MLERGPPAPTSAATDVVVGFVETHGRPHDGRAGRRPRGASRARASTTAAPTFEEMDLDAVLARDPRSRSSTSSPTRTCPARATRSAGRTSRSCSTPASTSSRPLNIQHLESLNDVVEQITGVKQRETIPDAVVRRADQIELVDMTPEALRRRHGARQHLPRRADRRRARQLLPARQPRRAARARAAVGRRPGRRRPRRSTASATASSDAVGDARAGRRRAHRRAGRGPAHPAGRADGPARPTASSSPCTSSPQDGLAAAARRAARAQQRGWSRSSAAATTRSSAPTSPRRSSRSRARAERHPDRPRREPPLALAAS